MPTLPKFKQNLIDQGQNLELSSRYVVDLLPKDHDCHIYAELSKNIDTTELEKQYHHLSQHAYHPRHIVSILTYSYSHDVFSSREIGSKCRKDLAFMFISQMNCPNFRVVNDFRKDNADFFHACFKQCIEFAITLQMLSFGHISLDGSKFKVNTSKHKAMRYKRLKLQEAKLTAEINTLIQKATCRDTKEDEEYKEANRYSVVDDLSFKAQQLEKINPLKKQLNYEKNQSTLAGLLRIKKQISFADHEANIMEINLPVMTIITTHKPLLIINYPCVFRSYSLTSSKTFQPSIANTMV